MINNDYEYRNKRNLRPLRIIVDFVVLKKINLLAITYHKVEL